MKKNSTFPIILILTFVLALTFSQTGLIKSVITDIKKSSEELRETINIVENANRQEEDEEYLFSDYSIPYYDGKDVIVVNDNNPFFSQDDIVRAYSPDYEMYISFIELKELDKLGRTQVSFMSAGPESLADEERESIGQIKPSGWNQARYDDLIKDKYLWNRCHLLAHSISELNAEEKNLITCTRQMNIGGMLDYEKQVINYIEDTQNHVLYRVTPLYKDSELVARGALMEGLSLEKEGLKFCVFVYNVQDGIEIDYKDGSSSRK